MGAPTDAARAEVLARRAELLVETQRLEASARAAVDIPAKIRRQPAKTAGIAAGTAFLVLGGPQRLVRRARRLAFGPQADLPKSMLPKEIDKNLRKLGTDGDKVRPILEREFASYLNERSKLRTETERAAQLTAILGNVLRPISYRVGLRLAEQLFDPDAVLRGGAPEDPGTSKRPHEPRGRHHRVRRTEAPTPANAAEGANAGASTTQAGRSTR